MSNVAVQKHNDETKSAWSLFDDSQELFNKLQRRAFDLFQERGADDGQALDDWFRAERDWLEMPVSELTEDENQVHVRAAVPGLKAGDVTVTATPRELVIRGETSTRNKGKKGEAHFSEFSQKQIFRRFGLPTQIDVDHVAAHLEDGMLTIDMPKAAAAKPVKAAAAAA
jgi:HSP20 family protein